MVSPGHKVYESGVCLGMRTVRLRGEMSYLSDIWKKKYSERRAEKSVQG